MIFREFLLLFCGIACTFCSSLDKAAEKTFEKFGEALYQPFEAILPVYKIDTEELVKEGFKVEPYHMPPSHWENLEKEVNDFKIKEILPLEEGHCDTFPVQSTGYWQQEWCHKVGIKQFHVQNDGILEPLYSLGVFNAEKSNSTVHYFENGQRCDETNSNRHTMVKFKCSHESMHGKIIDFTEPETCRYNITVADSTLCDEVKRTRNKVRVMNEDLLKNPLLSFLTQFDCNNFRTGFPSLSGRNVCPGRRTSNTVFDSQSGLGFDKDISDTVASVEIKRPQFEYVAGIPVIGWHYYRPYLEEVQIGAECSNLGFNRTVTIQYYCPPFTYNSKPMPTEKKDVGITFPDKMFVVVGYEEVKTCHYKFVVEWKAVCKYEELRPPMVIITKK